MSIIGGFFLLEVLLGILVAVMAFQFTAWARQRRAEKNRRTPPPGFIRTNEVNIDPTTGVEQRVWYNPETGERWYESR
jgi:hypothetical protein